MHMTLKTIGKKLAIGAALSASILAAAAPAQARDRTMTAAGTMPP